MAGGEKLEKRPRKRKETSAKRWNAFQSKDVVSVVILFVGFLFNQFTDPVYLSAGQALFSVSDEQDSAVKTLTVTGCVASLREVLKRVITALQMLAIGLLMILMVGVQTGFLVSGELLKLQVQ